MKEHTEQEKRGEKRPPTTNNKSKDHFLLKHAYILFCNLADTSESSVVESALYFIDLYEFTAEDLPPTLFEAVEERIEIEAKGIYYDDMAQEGD